MSSNACKPASECRVHSGAYTGNIYIAYTAYYCRLESILSPVHTSDNVAKNRDIVAETVNTVAKNTMLPVSATMSPFLATLSLVWTGL